MKNTQFAAALCLCAVFFSCAGSPAKTEPDGLRLEHSTEAVKLFPDRADHSPVISFDFTLLETGGAEREKEFLYSVLYGEKNPALYREKLVDTYSRAYFSANGSVPPSGPMSENLNWEYIERMDFYMLNERGLVITRESYGIYGGANGEEIRRYYVIDYAAPRLLHMEDFFTEKGLALLPETTAKALRQSVGAGGNGSADLPLPDSFFIDDRAMTLSWQPGKIAARSAGGIELALPWRTIRPLLRHDAMELLEKFGIDMFM